MIWGGAPSQTAAAATAAVGGIAAANGSLGETIAALTLAGTGRAITSGVFEVNEYLHRHAPAAPGTPIYRN